MRTGWMLVGMLLAGCGGDGGDGAVDTDVVGSTGANTSGITAGATSSAEGSTGTTANPTDADSSASASSSTTDPSTTASMESSSGTGGGSDFPDVDVSDPQLFEFELDPAALDPSVQDAIALQYAHLDTRAAPLGKLVFFLSGFTNTPAAWRNFGVHLAGYGFHVVEPHYANDWTCDGSPDCNPNTRWEALVGEDLSPVIDISRADSAEGRVVTSSSISTKPIRAEIGGFISTVRGGSATSTSSLRASRMVRRVAACSPRDDRSLAR